MRVPVTGEMLAGATDPATAVAARQAPGGASPPRVQEHARQVRRRVTAARRWNQARREHIAQAEGRPAGGGEKPRVAPRRSLTTGQSTEYAPLCPGRRLPARAGRAGAARSCHPLHGPGRSIGDRTRVQYGGDGLDAVDQARARPHDDAVRVDRPDRQAGKRPDRQPGLLDRAGQVIAARRDHDRGRVPPRRPRPMWPAPTARRAGAATGSPPAARDQVGDPVPGGERRIHPLDDRDPGPRPARRRWPRPRAQPGTQLRRPGASARSGTPVRAPTSENRVQHLVERVRIERQHVGPAAQVAQRVLDLAGRQRAHPAQVLGQDQVGIQLRQRLRVQGVQVRARRQLRADVARRSRRGSSRWCPARPRRPSCPSGRWRLVALECHPDQLLAEAERVDDLGRRRQQGHQPHAPRIGTIGVGGRPGPGRPPARARRPRVRRSRAAQVRRRPRGLSAGPHGSPPGHAGSPPGHAGSPPGRTGSAAGPRGLSAGPRGLAAAAPPSLG